MTLLLVPTRLERDGLSLPRFPGVTIAVCGMGPVAAAVGAAGLLARERYGACLLVGLAGARRPDLPAGSLVVGTAVRNEAVGLGAGDAFRPLAELAPEGESVPPDLIPLDPPPGLAAVAARDWPASLDRPVCAGVVGTVACPSGSPEQAAAWARRHADVLVEEMEGHAVALACRAAGVPLSIVRAVSNRAGERGKAQWDVPAALAALSATLPRLLGVPS